MARFHLERRVSENRGSRGYDGPTRAEAAGGGALGSKESFRMCEDLLRLVVSKKPPRRERRVYLLPAQSCCLLCEIDGKGVVHRRRRQNSRTCTKNEAGHIS